MIDDIQPTTTKLLDTRNNISNYLHFVSSQDMEGLRHHVVQLECCGPVSVYVQVVHDIKKKMMMVMMMSWMIMMAVIKRRGVRTRLCLRLGFIKQDKLGGNGLNA